MTIEPGTARGLVIRSGLHRFRQRWLESRRPALILTMGLLVSGYGCGPRVPLDVESALGHLTAPPIDNTRPEAVSDMLSSYDRTGGNMDWADLRELWIGDDDYLLADLRGPGCVKRIWTTNVRAAEWRFYFDDESEPRLAMRERDLFSSRLDQVFPFEPPLTDRISGGAFCYVPLPYRHRLRIVIREPYSGADARPYYHINYETYPHGTRVTSYPGTLEKSAREAVRHTQAAFGDPEMAMTRVAGRLDWQSGVAHPGAVLPLFSVQGRAGLLETIGIRLDPPEAMNAVQRARLLRELVLLAYWDGAEKPSVEVPLGDFFCNGLHMRRFASLLLANINGALISRFPMPFQRSARVMLRHDGSVPVSVAYATESTERVSSAHRFFHASWTSALSPGQPFQIMQTNGRGQFLGTYLIALGMEQGWNILEGDEFFFRDGGREPVQHGTGLEDYFNGGWYYTGLFEQPLHGLTEKAAMRTAQYRLQVPDPVTFERSLQMFMEFGDGNRSSGYKSAAAYWYQDRPTASGSRIPDMPERFPPIEQVGVASIMSELFELERAGLDREAEDRSAYYATLFDGQPLGEIFALRKLAYQEIRLGADAVSNAYQAIAGAETTTPVVAREAELLHWRQAEPYRALFGGHGHADMKLFVNGQEIGEGGDPFTYRAYPVELDPGEHLLQAEITSHGDHSWFLTGFFSDFAHVVSDVSWDYSESRPPDWPGGTGDESLWRPYRSQPGFLPTMQWWRFTPNAFPAVQCFRQAGGPFRGWEQPAGRRIYLRRRIIVPDAPAERTSPFVRSTVIRSPAMRPVDDTSNMLLSP